MVEVLLKKTYQKVTGFYLLGWENVTGATPRQSDDCQSPVLHSVTAQNVDLQWIWGNADSH
jgi:hypothetical protein